MIIEDCILNNAYMELREESGILNCRFEDNLDLNLSISKECVKNRLDFSSGLSYPVLIDLRGLRSISKEAREYLAREGAEGISAGALLVSSPVSRIIGNLFLKVNSPSVPTRLFTSKEEARQWLISFMSKN